MGQYLGYAALIEGNCTKSSYRQWNKLKDPNLSLVLQNDMTASSLVVL